MTTDRYVCAAAELLTLLSSWLHTDCMLIASLIVSVLSRVMSRVTLTSTYRPSDRLALVHCSYDVGRELSGASHGFKYIQFQLCTHLNTC